MPFAPTANFFAMLWKGSARRTTRALRVCQTPAGAGREDEQNGGGKAFVFDRRESEAPRVIGRLVALNGTQGVISCPLRMDEEEWSVGHLITIVHRRLASGRNRL